MLKKTFFIFLLFLSVYTGYAQYSCKATSVCEEGALENNTVLFIRYFNEKNLLVREVENSIYGYDNPYVRIYEYDEKDRLVGVIDSNFFVKTIKQYSYFQNRIREIKSITSSLSTENIEQNSNLLMDTTVAPQPTIVYIRLMDTLIDRYYYDHKGVLSKIVKQSDKNLDESTETFGYDEKGRLIQSVFSDKYKYRYYYDSASRLIKKEKFHNTYIDDSGIGPDQKPESLRLKKAVWELVSSQNLSYNKEGKLRESVEFGRGGSRDFQKENYFYDEKGRLKETTEYKEIGDAYFPLCRTIYQYE